jgi:predicted extracellular nuclease
MKKIREDCFMRKQVLSLLVLSIFLFSTLIPSSVYAQTPVVTIMEIQGEGQFSPYDGQVVQTSGVVTLFTANGANCWIQDPRGDRNPSTSDGVFVSGCGFPAKGTKPSVGDLIVIEARVQEQQFGNALPLTRLRNVASITIQSSGNRLPKPGRDQYAPQSFCSRGDRILGAVGRHAGIDIQCTRCCPNQ